jgi:hypothetical protein
MGAAVKEIVLACASRALFPPFRHSAIPHFLFFPPCSVTFA